MNKYQVWIEGYRATGEHGIAEFHGEYEAENFEDACIKMMTEKKWDMEKYYNPERNSFWACGFFDNEKDARKNYG